ncbi:polysaccharide pyruvyl transferase family protein [Siminovitchia acidinfaciens]|uniref:Polysaccharide pyruvyl transferase family protein n=1 Tax=Siminovitchia acidinfaciens TaxID=2321395 RepID=A0A429XZD1_9BACI|nr:polysaccharide pyruvyl transferase family protein [Siminovitchia acidinfaciens]RST74171.1 polysaccharide pyruvyl transferase family protein [Siminovitchia acidinfaciens]
MKKVALLGAFDRFNYGDLLFPIILEKYLKENLKIQCEFEYYGLIQSDLTSLGGKKTNAIDELYLNNAFKKDDCLILVGGEMLGATWYQMILCLIESKFLSFSYKVAKKLTSEKRVSNFLQKKMNVPNSLPWVINPENFDAPVKVMYNAVGGSSIPALHNSEKHYLSQAMERAKYISVRDKISKDNLENASVNKRKIKEFPDSAIIMSDMFQKEQLPTKFNKEALNWLNKNKPYLVFQVNNDIGKNKVNLIGKQLLDIHNKTGFEIVLLPIGTAANHEDHIPLKKIYDYLGRPSFVFLPQKENIYEIMGLIAYSQIYIGTSLHGAITALSYNVPHLAFTDTITKLIEFIKTWEPEEGLIYTNVNDMSNNIMEKVKTFNTGKSKRYTFTLKKLAYENLESMRRCIEG